MDKLMVFSNLCEYAIFLAEIPSVVLFMKEGSIPKVYEEAAD